MFVEDTLGIELCAKDTNFPDIFESYTNSSIEIHFVDYEGRVTIEPIV